MKLVFSDQAWADYQYWVSTNDKVGDRINEMIKQSKRPPFKGTGKPLRTVGFRRRFRGYRLAVEA